MLGYEVGTHGTAGHEVAAPYAALACSIASMTPLLRASSSDSGNPCSSKIEFLRTKPANRMLWASDGHDAAPGCGSIEVESTITMNCSRTSG